MINKVIKKTMDIPAPKEKVFEVLVDDECTKRWFAEFGEGAHAETTWEEGSKVSFTDDTQSGLVGVVMLNRPGEILSVKYTGIVADGLEDYDSDLAKEVIGTMETYVLTEKDGITTLSVDVDMSDEYYDIMSEAWDNALQKIKELAVSR